MKNFKLNWRSIVPVLLFSTTAFFLCGAAVAQVSGFVLINPIAVCNSNGISCPPFGVKCGKNISTGIYSCTKYSTPSAADLSTPIGFVDADTNTNLTRAILAQSGIDVAFFPIKQYNSPNSNADPWLKIAPTYSATNYQSLHLKNVTCKDGTIVQTSPDFQALTQHQICTEHKGTPVGVSNPPPTPSPAPPLASTLGSTRSNAIDVFFVTNLVPPSPSVLYGFSWINGNGIAIDDSTFDFSSTGTPAGPRFDTLAHELAHALALDHTTFGAGAAKNLLTSGTTRTIPSTSGCSAMNPYGGFANTNSGVLYALGDPSVVPTSCIPAPMPTADFLTFGLTCTDLTACTNQTAAMSLSPFINQTLASTANAGGGAQAAVARLATTSSNTSTGEVPFEVNAATTTGESGEAINSIIIALPDSNGVTFSGSAPATQTGGTGGVNIINQVRLNGNSGIGNSNCAKSINLSPPSVQCLQIYFSTGDAQGNAFTAGASVTFNLALNKDNATVVQNSLLTGAQFTVITKVTADTPLGYATTSMFGSPDPITGVFKANSQFPDFTTPNQIDPNFVNAAVVKLGHELSKCTPPYTGAGPHLQCPGGKLPSGPD